MLEIVLSFQREFVADLERIHDEEMSIILPGILFTKRLSVIELKQIKCLNLF